MKPRTGQQTLSGIGGVRRVARMRRGIEAQLTAQRTLGHLEAVDAGLIALARTYADAMDTEVQKLEPSEYNVATLGARLFPVLLELRGERRDTATAGVDDELAALVAALRDAARPGPSDDGPANPGPSGPPAS